MPTPERVIDYRCGGCGTETEPAELTIKRAVFQNLTDKKVVRSRTVEWLCGLCLGQDPNWNQPLYTSPGMADTKRTRV